MSDAVATETNASGSEAARRRLQALVATTAPDHALYEAVRHVAYLGRGFADAYLAVPLPADLPEVSGPETDAHDGAGGLATSARSRASTYER